MKLDWTSGRRETLDVGETKDICERRAAYIDCVSPPEMQREKKGAGDVTSVSVEKGRETLFVNASIMDVEYRPVNAPWVVDLELPVVE